MKLADAFKIMETQFRQCRLRRGNVEQVAWIPRFDRGREIAKRGKYLNIKGVNGWQVIGCGAIQSSEYVREHERDYRTQRQASDI